MGTRSVTSSKISLDVQANIKNTLGSGVPATAAISGSILNATLTSGVSAFQFDRAWEEKAIAISSGNTVDINLRTLTGRDIGAGTGLDAVGQTILNEEIVALIVKKTGGAGKLQINATLPSNPIAWIPLNAASNSTGGALKTGGARAWVETHTDGLVTTSGSANVRFSAVSGDVTFDLYVFGRHDTDESSSSSNSSSSSSSLSTSSSSNSSSSP